MSLRIGIVGLPNVGKSTLFNALLKRQQALVANYPFATIEPNVGVVEVPDGRLEKLAEVVQTNKVVQATVEFVDIAGLVAGASTGAGLGNKFLSHIREVDVICYVLRDFSDENVTRAGSTNPKDDLEILRMELQLADLQTQENRKTKGKNNPDDDLNLLTEKPEIVVYNTDENNLAGAGVRICAKIEAELATLAPGDARAYMSELGIIESGLDKLIKKAYETLDKISFLTAGEIEARAWTIRRGSTALMASGAIHTDFMKKFIKAKICSYDDFVKFNGWRGAAEAGKVRFEGKEYEMQDGDVVEFMIGSL